LDDLNRQPPRDDASDSTEAERGSLAGFPFQALLDAIPIPLLYKDAEGRILGCNLAMTGYTGMEPMAMVGKTADDLLPPEEAARMAAIDQELLRTGGSLESLEAMTSRALGVRQVLLHKSAFHHPDGTPAGLVTTAQDVTDQRDAEAALVRSQELFSTISRHLTDLLAILDRDGRRVYTSPSYSTMLGYSPEELGAMPPLEHMHPDDRDATRVALARAFEQGAPQSVDYRLRHRSGAWLDFEANVSPIHNPTGPPSQALVIARDATARKQAERERQQMEVQLRHAQKLESIGSLAAGIAHEINTPTQYIGDNASFLGGVLPDVLACLEAMGRFLERMRALPPSPEEAQELLTRIQALDLEYLAEEVPNAIRQSLDGVARVASLVRAMKDFSHPGGETKEPADLNRAIDSTLTVSRNEWKYVARMEADLDPALPPVPCVQGEINQAVLNLVVNAAHAIEEALGGRHTGRQGLIRVTTRRVGQEVRISVADDGAGIPQAIRERIFEPFFTTKPVGRGTGQGLAIVHSVVVEKHGGRIELESEPGRGTTFHLFLPLADRSQPEDHG
jgi:PAS domain S-box-containing protein